MKRKALFLTAVLAATTLSAQDASDILNRIEKNLSSDNRIFESTMTISGNRSSRTISSRTYAAGNTSAYTEYMAPAREQGTKMLKLENQLWIYSPSTDRTIQISGHMLKQSVMGSDLSYEDMMDDRKITEVYDAIITGSEEIEGKKTWILELTAKVSDAAYSKRKMWVDAERYVPVREEMYARSGQLLKRTTLSEVKNIDGRWFPTRVVYKDMLRQGDGTEFTITSIRFNQEIPAHIFTKAVLR